ncbi:MAG: ribosome biogenesis GTPase Der [Gammaproteobacteria bacterium]|nr:MAG: ribosome biogenesis GTPase Der [Gammaproteobacteria bacterium]
MTNHLETNVVFGDVKNDGSAGFQMPVIALVGRPNVGKSTLFNLLTKTRNSLVADTPGVTRDRQYGIGKEGICPYWVVDTGGMLRGEESLDSDVDSQARLAVDECDIIFLLVDAKDGLQAHDADIINYLRRQNKPLYLLVNKIDFGDADMLMAEFYALGLSHTYAISAAHKKGIKALMQSVLDPYAKNYKKVEEPLSKRLNMTIIGRPNAGKSTLINRFLGEERVIASDVAGTTRDSIAIPFEYEGQAYTLVDTAGVRRKSRVNEHVEKISVIKTLQAIEQSNVIVLMMDAHEGIGDLDAHLLSVAVDAGKALVIAVNKWDHLDTYEKFKRQSEIERKLGFIDYVKIHFISALHGTGIRDVLASVRQAYAASFVDLSANQLTRQLQELMYKHQPALVRGYAVKMRYAHQGGKNPPIIVIHGSRLSHVQPAYLRYLEKGMREAFGLYGTPIRFQLKESDNPYKH